MQRHFGQIRTTTHLPLPKVRTIRKRCNFDLDRFEPPHQFETASNGKNEKAFFFQRTDPNYRKADNDLLKTKKKPRQQTVANSIRFQLPDKLEFVYFLKYFGANPSTWMFFIISLNSSSSNSASMQNTS